MNTPPENDFAELRRLLSVKRHEQPPPGYFNNFSREVIASLRAERQTRRTRTRRSTDGPLWITGLLERLQAHPALSGAFGAVLCALAIGGILLSEGGTQKPSAMPSLLSEVTTGSQPIVGAEASGPPAATAFQPVMADSTSTLVASNNLQLAPGSTLFDSFPGLETAPVGYR